ncbi:hypothetical protein BS50DRAFT_572057 [Corynespora cassiicola Philippines]|uniref:Uncharacterized protein n=1 Tax=Corynespora cassiicola Philippines TaxID=1448308 RepID=A0A2T2NTV8_CORCC|nr:hypothetical protein BS50DRAFT_572057 [Corynespora cassiicola Philippines]
MTRPIHILVYSSPLFPAHWSLCIPHVDDPDIGTRIHVSGDAAPGYETAFERNYNLSTTSR